MKTDLKSLGLTAVPVRFRLRGTTEIIRDYLNTVHSDSLFYFVIAPHCSHSVPTAISSSNNKRSLPCSIPNSAAVTAVRRASAVRSEGTCRQGTVTAATFSFCGTATSPSTPPSRGHSKVPSGPASERVLLGYDSHLTGNRARALRLLDRKSLWKNRLVGLRLAAVSEVSHV